MSDDDDALVLLIADLHKSAAEAVEMRQKSRALQERWLRNRAEIQMTIESVGSNSLDRVATRRGPLLVRRWPGVYGEPS